MYKPISDSSSKKAITAALYIIGLIMIYPIIVYHLKASRMVAELPLLPGHIYVQVFLSAPVLLITGTVLFFKYKHRVAGVLFFMFGLLWLLEIIQDLTGEIN